MSNIDWNAVAEALPKEPPDAYHFRYEAGATKHPVEFGKYHGPAGNETPWDTYEAYCRHSAHPSDQYAVETLVLSFVRGIHEIAAGFLNRRHGRFKEMYADSGIETVGNDLFSEGMQVVIEILRRPPDFGPIGPGDLDEVEQLKQYIFRAARNRMLDFLRKMYPKWWSSALRNGLSEDDRLSDDEQDEIPHNNRVADNAISDQTTDPKAQEAAHLQALAAINEACTRDTDKKVVELRERDLPQEEIAEETGRSRDQVQRDLTRIQKKTEDLLGLPHGATKKRKRRKKGRDAPDDDEQARD